MLRVGHHRRYTANHTWHVDSGAHRLFVKLNPDRTEAAREVLGHRHLDGHYLVPRLLAHRSLGRWSIVVYERHPGVGTDHGLLVDLLAHAELSASHAELRAASAAILARYRRAVATTMRRVPPRQVVGKLFTDRAAPGGRLDTYYATGRPWLVLPGGSPLRPADLASTTLIINDRTYHVDFATIVTWLRDRFASPAPVWAALTQGDPTTFNVGWSAKTGAVWFDYDTAGVNALAGEFAVFLVDVCLHGAWLTPAVNPAAYRDHPTALAAARRPRVRLRHSAGGSLEIDAAHRLSTARRWLASAYLRELVIPVADQLGIPDLLTWLRPYLAIRLLGVYQPADLTRDQAALLLAALAQVLDPDASLDQVLGLDPLPHVTGRAP